MESRRNTWNYFIGTRDESRFMLVFDAIISSVTAKCISAGNQDLIPGNYPDDTDTTCLALSVLPSNPTAAEAVMSEILGLTTADGVFMVFLTRLLLNRSNIS